MFAYFGGIFELFLAIVGLLSGALSVFREWQIMYRPPKSDQRKVFWAFVRVAFLICTLTSWYNAFSSVKRREADLQTVQKSLVAETHASEVLRAQLEASRIPTIPEAEDSLRRRAKKLADEIDDFWDERNESHPPRSNGHAVATGEQADVNKKSDAYDAETGRVCLSRFGSRILGIPKEMAAKGLPVQWMDKFDSFGNLRCLYGEKILSGSETEILRSLSFS